MSRGAQRSLLISLLIGAALNFLLALFCLYKQEGPQTPTPGATAQKIWNRYAIADANEHGPATFLRLSGALGCDFITLDAANGDPNQPAPPRMMITRMGLPFRAFEAMHSWGPVQPTHSGGIPVASFRPNVAWVSIIPLRPIVSGLVLNTLLFGGLAWAVLFGPIAMVRRTQRQMRMLRRHCPQCDYDLQGNLDAGCPECGWRRTNP